VDFVFPKKFPTALLREDKVSTPSAKLREINRKWRDNDPNFGYETVGADLYTAYNYIRGCKVTCGGTGVMQSITAYVKQYNTGTPRIKYALYDDNGTSSLGTAGYPGTLLDYTVEWTLTAGWDNWKTLACVVGYTVAAKDYWLMMWAGDAGVNFKRLIIARVGCDKSLTYNSWPNPLTLTGEKSEDYSIYGSYGVVLPTPVGGNVLQAKLAGII